MAGRSHSLSQNGGTFPNSTGPSRQTNRFLTNYVSISFLLGSPWRHLCFGDRLLQSHGHVSGANVSGVHSLCHVWATPSMDAQEMPESTKGRCGANHLERRVGGTGSGGARRYVRDSRKS